MSVTLKLRMKLEMKITAGEPIWHIVPAFSDGPRSIFPAVGTKRVENVQLGPTRETQGIGSKLWLDEQ